MNGPACTRACCAGFVAAGIVLLSGPATAAEPPLPTGLAPAAVDEPALPDGLGGEATAGSTQTGHAGDVVDEPGLLRFWDTRVGIRMQDDDRVDDDFTLAETRLRLEVQQQWDRLHLELKSDLVFDAVADDRGIDIERQEGWMQLREFTIGVQPHSQIDVSLGRQVLTWGTGDLIFFNDLFPKDFNAFFIGRAEEYLKSPVDAFRMSAYSELFDIDVVYSPRFDPNLYLDPRRLSFYGSPGDTKLRVDTPDDWFSDDEWYLRAYRRAGSWELALYGYDRFWKGPGRRVSTSTGRAGSSPGSRCTEAVHAVRWRAVSSMPSMAFTIRRTRDSVAVDTHRPASSVCCSVTSASWRASSA